MTEAEFERAIEAEPDSAELLSVYSDWLEEQGDWRAAGYRWMGENRKRPFCSPTTGSHGWVLSDDEDCSGIRQVLPLRFLNEFRHIVRQFSVSRSQPAHIDRHMVVETDYVVEFGSRRLAREALCRVLHERPELAIGEASVVGGS